MKPTSGSPIGTVRHARSQRLNPTPPESRMWEELRARRCLGLKFRRQCPLGGYIADIYCHELRLVIEIDGQCHSPAAAQERDSVRDQAFLTAGITVIHVPARLVLNELPRVVQLLHRCLQPRIHRFLEPIEPPPGHGGFDG